MANDMEYFLELAQKIQQVLPTAMFSHDPETGIITVKTGYAYVDPANPHSGGGKIMKYTADLLENPPE